MIEDIDGIGFKTADELALKTGGTLDNPERLKAGIIYSIIERTYRRTHARTKRDKAGYHYPENC